MSSRASEDLSVRIVDWLRTNWVWPVLVAIFLLSFWIRIIPLDGLSQACMDNMVCLRALDPFYIYRQSWYLVSHDLHFADFDPLRYYPEGFNPSNSYAVTYYLPAMMYLVASKILLGMSYYTFAKYYPAFMGAILVFPIFFIARELWNDRAGVVAAVFLATTQTILYRTSGGFIEKEPAATIFMLLTIYYFVRGLKRESYPSFVAAALSLSLMSMAWGGTRFMYLFLPLFTLVAVLLYPNDRRFVYGYLATVFLSLLFPYVIGCRSSVGGLFYGNIIVLGNIAFAGLLLIAELAKKYSSFGRENPHLVVPILLCLGLVGFLLLPLFSSEMARLVTSFIGVVTIKKEVVATTVAENSPGDWSNIIGSLSTDSAAMFSLYGVQPFKALSFLNTFTELWFWAFLGLFMVIGMTLFRLHWREWLYLIGSIIVSLFLRVAGFTLLPISILVLALLYVFFKAKIDWRHLFLILWLSSTVYGVFGKIRILFFVGPAAAVLGAIALVTVLEWLYPLVTRLFSGLSFLEGRERLVSLVVISLFVAYVAGANIASAYVFGQSLSLSRLTPKYQDAVDSLMASLPPTGATYGVFPSYGNWFSNSGYSEPWQEAMLWLQENSTPDSVVMSWWDYGYWFQTGGRRTSVADGGNTNLTRNVVLARYFTSEDPFYTSYDPSFDDPNFTHWLATHSVDYIVVDYTLIGKYSALSKIAHNGTHVDYFIHWGLPSRIETNGNTTIAMYSLGSEVLYVPIDRTAYEQARLIIPTSNRIVLVSGGRKYYIRYLCTHNGTIDLNPPEPSIDTCIIFSKYGILLPAPTMNPALSNFARLYLYDGAGIPYVRKVFDNHYVKIFEVEDFPDEVPYDYPPYEERFGPHYNYLVNDTLGLPQDGEW